MVVGSAEHRLVVFDGEPTRAVCSVEQQQLQAALAVGARASQLTILDYLK